jgi:hypothetical protein
VLRQLVVSTTKVKKYYGKNLNGERYVSHYVQMEFTRGFIINCMQFYAKVVMPGSNGYQDALQLWSNLHQSRAVKSVVSLASAVHASLDQTTAARFITDKSFQANRLSHLITRLIAKAKNHKSPGSNDDLCFRSNYRLAYDPIMSTVVSKDLLKTSKNLTTVKNVS